ncbi:DUF4114 domain-containing protein [Cylindrospermopsis raciborskii]|uniref:DUF4114 domain-containing protein n=1 Tax=Cylindrospermopsis raciborskii TaxID=77022 RepID=UPI000778D25C|nr:DUF4114 domain-containing protein [Cylindrospermopsis raciborskii]
MTKITNQALNSALNQLWVFSLSSDFWEVFDAAFGTEYNRKNAEILRSQWQIGDFSQLPEIEILDSSILGSANGAYSSSENRIYLSSNLMENGTSSRIREVLIEEIGHFVDSRINQIDTPGDEGEYFAGLLVGESLNEAQLSVLKAEIDSAIILLNGVQLTVETATPNTTDNSRLIYTPSGDGGLKVRLDKFGGFGYGGSGEWGALYDPLPVGTQNKGEAQTTYYSVVALGIINNGETTSRKLLQNLGNNASFESSSNTTVNSTFSTDGLKFKLRQSVQDTFADQNQSRTGSRLDQTYTITNTTDQTINFDLIRYVDGDLDFDGSIYDGGGRIVRNAEEILFETDKGGTGQSDTTFFGITSVGGNIPTTNRWELNEFDELNRLNDPMRKLKDKIVLNDTNADQFIDEGREYDVTLELRNEFSLAAGGIATYTTSTLFGSGEPTQLDITPPTGKVRDLPRITTDRNITVSWDANDTQSGVKNYDVFVSVNSGNFTEWLTDVITTSAVYPGQVGNTYAFYSLATDNQGNQQDPNTAPRTSTQVVPIFTPNVVTPKLNISTGLIFTAQSNGNITLDTNRGSATPDEVTSVQNGTKSNFNHIIGLYEVLNSQGEIKDDQGKTLKPEDANYALHALTTARVKNFTVQAGGNDTPSTATQLGSGVSVFAGKSYAPFVIANGGTYFGPGDQGIENFVAAEQGDINRFSSKDQYVRNLVADEGKDGDIFNNAPRFVQEPVAYFSFGVANPDKAPHFRSYGNGVYGFEDLPANFTQYSNNDFNDGVFALTLSI